ncbi:MAG: YjdF family protein [Firmicutes bacterium]|nr:YjdF family protein [Bacillota bacterium]MBQ9603989.1 YjdF family protein [Bacillota bacterium]
MTDNIGLTVFFDDPFWVGVFERTENGSLSVCRAVFGTEPKDYEVYEFIQCNFYKLRFSRAIGVESRKKADNPKRRQRNAKKQLESSGIGTKAQQALKKQQEENKIQRKQISCDLREEEAKRRFMLKQEKRREKHKGH